MPDLIRNLYQPKLQIFESTDKDPLPEGVVARVVGPMALLEGVSLNGRNYTRSLWETGIEGAKDRLDSHGLFGTCGHKIALDEATVAAGQISHKVVGLWPNPKNGTLDGEIHILETEAGKNLNFMMRQGFPMAVSTRAYGEVLKGKGPRGTDLIDESTFYLETIDFVTNPGVPIARPQIVETADTDKESIEMSEVKELFESMSKERVELQADLKVALNENVTLKADLDKKTALFEALETKAKRLEAIEEGLRKWTELEPFKSMAQKTGLHNQSEGSSEKILSMINEAFGDYAKLGSVQEISEAKENLAKYEELGTLDEINAGTELLEQFTKFGKKPSELKKLFEKADKIVDIYKTARRKLVVQKVAKRHQVNEALVESMLEGSTVEKVINTLKQLKAASNTNHLKINEENQKPIPVPTKAKGNLSVVENIFENMNNSAKDWKPTPDPRLGRR